MANLKELRVRIGSVRSTQKITAAMKMVAASKLRRAQVAAEAVRPYADRMERMVSLLAEGFSELSAAPPLLAGTGKDEAPTGACAVRSTPTSFAKPSAGFSACARWARR